MKNTIITIFGLLLLLGACKEEDCCDASNPDCSNFDPCYGYPERPADFTMEVLLRGNGNKDPYHSPVYDGDRMHYYNTMVLSAIYPNADSYEWQIGNETERREGQKINVFFAYPFGDIDITLFVNYSKDASCFSGYNMVDTLTKTINLTHSDSIPYLGTFHGYFNDNPLDTNTFYFYKVPINNLGQLSVYMWDLPNGCGPHKRDGVDVFRYGARETLFSSSGSSGCNDIEGVISYSEDYEKIEVNFYYDKYGENHYDFDQTFTGYKIE